ncbi:type II secretion system protein J [Elusimicrobiota bacterium]
MKGSRRHLTRGTTLLETLVAIALLSIAILGIYSVGVATTRQERMFLPNEESLESVANLREVLKNYVTADCSAATAADFAPGGTWRLPGDSRPCALEVGIHEAKAHLSLRMRRKFPNANMRYTVTKRADDTLSVSFEVTW